jgi:hypothetical protein
MKNFSDSQKKRIKGFTRFLKELGIYKEWLRARVAWLKRYGYYEDEDFSSNKELVFRCAYLYPDLSSVITESFTWSESGFEQMWSELFDLAEYNTKESKNAIEDKVFMKEAKDIVKYYVND